MKGVLARITNGPTAPARIVQAADVARDLGCRNVAIGYEPTTGSHVVTGETPDAPESPRQLLNHS